MQISFLVTMEQAINYLSNQGLNAASNINFENNIKLYRAAAHKKISKHIGYEFIDTTYVDELLSGKNSRFLYVNNRPVTSIDAIKLDDVAIDKSLYFTIDDACLYHSGGFVPGEFNYKVTYKAGWNQTTMPGDIRLAAMQLIALYVGQNGGAGTTIGKTSISTGNGGSESIDPDAEKNILATLDGYKRYDRL